MIRSYKNKLAEHLFHGVASKEARHFPASLKIAAIRKLTLLDAATRLETLRVPPANRLEALQGGRTGQYSVRINDQWRICFRWTDEGPTDVEIVDYH